MLGAEEVLLDPGIEVCLERAATDRQQLVKNWYEKNQSNLWKVPIKSGFPSYGGERGDTPFLTMR